MKKEYHLKYIDHTEFKKLYKEWAAKVNNPLYVKVWDMAENFVIAQKRNNNAFGGITESNFELEENYDEED